MRLAGPALKLLYPGYSDLAEIKIAGVDGMGWHLYLRGLAKIPYGDNLFYEAAGIPHK